VRARTSSGIAAILERILVTIGVVCLLAYGWMWFGIHRQQADEYVKAQRMLTARDCCEPLEPPTPITATAGLVGQLDIPRVRVSAVVIEGDGESVLRSAVGYLPDTPPPWQPGNSAVAAHRDRLFRPLQGIRVGDDIWLATPHGDFHYRVRRTLVVNPGDVWVLDALPHVNLTLITCFPFVYVGHAPQRFIVQAEKIQARARLGYRPEYSSPSLLVNDSSMPVRRGGGGRSRSHLSRV
jgi:sortase A